MALGVLSLSVPSAIDSTQVPVYERPSPAITVLLPGSHSKSCSKYRALSVAL